MLYLITRKVPAIKTKLRDLSLKGRTVLDLALPAGNWFVGVRSSATRASVLFPQVCQTNAAIHSAGRDKRRIICDVHCNYQFQYLAKFSSVLFLLPLNYLKHCITNLSLNFLLSHSSTNMTNVSSLNLPSSMVTGPCFAIVKWIF